MSTDPLVPREASDELPEGELLRRAKPLPSHAEMVIGDLDVEERAGFLAALER